MQKGRILNFRRFSLFAGSSYFLADWRVLTWKVSFRNCFGRFALRSPEIMYVKNTQVSSGDLLFNEKQKKPFVSLTFISHTITVISYCCFVSTSDWGTERGWCEFVLSWHRFETKSANFFSFFYLFLYLFQNPKHLFKENI